MLAVYWGLKRLCIWGFPSMGIPQNGWLRMEHPRKPPIQDWNFRGTPAADMTRMTRPSSPFNYLDSMDLFERTCASTAQAHSFPHLTSDFHVNVTNQSNDELSFLNFSLFKSPSTAGEYVNCQPQIIIAVRPFGRGNNTKLKVKWIACQSGHSTYNLLNKIATSPFKYM